MGDGAHSGKPDGRKNFVDGVLMKSDSGADPAYYYKKREAEARLGRPLTTEEFQRDHYAGPGEDAEGWTSGTSIFDPVLCELLVRWFSPPGGAVLDPFAGGATRGIVAGVLGRRYLGVDLRPEQVAANEAQADAIVGPGHVRPEWIVGDSAELPALVPPGYAADLVLSCPPYADLERYSDDPRDVSTLPYDEFSAAYRRIVAASVALLRPDRFVAWVVGDMRDARGIYRDFPGLTVSAFRDAGAELYNWGILVTALGSLPIRAGRAFAAARKLGKTHQDVLVFVKGDPAAAAAACGDLADEDLALPATAAIPGVEEYTAP